MRHYFGFDIEGNLISIETYGPAGWPTTHRLDDPTCTENSVVSLRERRAISAPEIINWVLFDCPCNPGQGDLLKNCTCTHAKFAENAIDPQTKSFVLKPLRTVYVDGVVVNHMDVVTKAPGTVVNLKIVAPSIADGEKAEVKQKGQVDLTLESEWEMVFTGGETPEKALTAPSQGNRGIVSIHGRLIRPFVFALRGFA